MRERRIFPQQQNMKIASQNGGMMKYIMMNLLSLHTFLCFGGRRCCFIFNREARLYEIVERQEEKCGARERNKTFSILHIIKA
jgi:hypothetical protein